MGVAAALLSRRVVCALSASVAVVAFIPSCLEPTKITLDLRTDLPCESVRGVRVAAGPPGAVERAPPAVETKRCERGAPMSAIGTIVVTPSSGDGGRVAFRAVLGVDVDTSECTAERNYAGCIVQRRELAYVAHTPLVVPVDFLEDCRDVPCDERTTCVTGKRCVPSSIDPDDCIPPRRCYPPGDPSGDAPPPGEPPVVAGDAGDVADAADADAGGADAGGKDSAPPGSGGAIQCPRGSEHPDDWCTPGSQVCCWAPGTSVGRCNEGTTCSGGEWTLSCTNRASCPGSSFCCFDNVDTFASACAPACTGEYLCLSNSDCVDVPHKPTCKGATGPLGAYGFCAQ